MGRQGRPNPTEHALSCKRCAKYRPSIRDNTRTVEVHPPRSSSRSRHKPLRLFLQGGRGVPRRLYLSHVLRALHVYEEPRGAQTDAAQSPGFFGCLTCLTGLISLTALG